MLLAMGEVVIDLRAMGAANGGAGGPVQTRYLLKQCKTQKSSHFISLDEQIISHARHVNALRSAMCGFSRVSQESHTTHPTSGLFDQLLMH